MVELIYTSTVPTFRGRAVTVARVAAPVLTVAAIVALLWPDLKRLVAPSAARAPAPILRLVGQELGAGGDAVADALDVVRRFARSTVVLRLPDGTQRELLPGNLGAEIDRVHLAEVVRAALDPSHPVGRSYRERTALDHRVVVDLPVPLRVSNDRAIRALVAIKDEVDQSPADAAVDLEKKELRAERIGYRLDVYGTLARIESALRSGEREVEAEVDRIAPRVLASALADVKFDEVLGWFETRYATDAKHATRTYNLRQAASRLDGTVLMPGEVFDFNETVGPRDEANGYKVAPVIAEGELVDGIGGGTCQISGTLHAAAFFAGLDILSRAPHTRPSSYIKLGLDAAVAYPAIDFRIRNNSDSPVVLHETVKGGVVRAEILGPRRKRTVSFFRVVDEVAPFEEAIRETEDLPKGKRVLVQRGVPGFKTTVVRVVREGAYAVRTKIRNHYPPTTQIIRVGTGPKRAAGDKTKVDTHPEYSADEYLVITQGPDIRTPGVTDPEPGGGMIESRVPGRYGSPGWQKKLGMKVFDSDEAESGDDGSAPENATRKGTKSPVKKRRDARRTRG